MMGEGQELLMLQMSLGSRAKAVIDVADDFARERVEIAPSPQMRMTPINWLDAKSGESEATARNMEVFRDDEDAPEIVCLEKERSVLRRGPRVDDRVVLEDNGARNAMPFEIAVHNDRFVVALATMAATYEDIFTVALLVKLHRVIEPRFQSVRRTAIGINLAAENDSQVSRLELVELAVEGNGN